MTDVEIGITLQAALERFPGVKPRVISDNGGQFISKDFRKFISLVDLVHTRISPNYPQSNGKIERFHRTITNECLKTNGFVTEPEMRQIIAKYIDFCNHNRLHSSLKYLPPASYLDGSYQSRLEVREKKIKKGEKQRKEYWLRETA